MADSARETIIDLEYEPISSFDNTELKVPVSVPVTPYHNETSDLLVTPEIVTSANSDYYSDSHLLDLPTPAQRHNDSLLNNMLTDSESRDTSACWDEDNESKSDYGYNMSDLDFQALDEYHAFIKIFKENPKDKCVQLFLRKYASSESDLDRLRCDYFEHLKGVSEDFPFDRNATLKRRMFTRSGEPVATRLAQDLYHIIEVIEGGDYFLIKEMISTSKSRKSSVHTQPSRNATSASSHPEKCQCGTELALLKDTISTIQASVLLLKQSVHASEQVRNQQISEIKSKSLSIKCDIDEFANVVNSVTASALQSIRDISCQMMARITEFEDRVRQVEVYLENENSLIPSHTPQSLQCIKESDSIYTATKISTTDTAGANFTVPDSFVQLPPEVPVIVTNEDIHNLPNMEIANVCTQTNLTDSVGMHPSSSSSENYGTLKRDGSVQCTVDQDKGANIPTIISNRPRDLSDAAKWYNDDFRLVERRRVERFCLLGLSVKIDTKLLISDVESRGPTVRSVRVFRIRKKPGQVLVKLTLSANEKSGLVLSDDFWPDYVHCEPWKSRESRGQQNSISARRMDRSFRDRGRIAQVALSEIDSKQQTRFKIPPRFRKIEQLQNIWHHDRTSYGHAYEAPTYNRFNDLPCDID